MGESKKDALRVNFDRKLKLEFHGVKVTSDAGLLAYREIDNVFGLTDMATYELTDNRTGKNTQHSITALLRQSVYSHIAGYEDTNDAERLAVGPVGGLSQPRRDTADPKDSKEPQSLPRATEFSKAGI